MNSALHRPPSPDCPVRPAQHRHVIKHDAPPSTYQCNSAAIIPPDMLQERELSALLPQQHVCAHDGPNSRHSLCHSWLVSMDGLAPWATAALTAKSQKKSMPIAQRGIYAYIID